MAGGGGAWKVAYADFVTAMMAFFMVMWLVSQDQKVKDSVAKYFVDPVGFSLSGTSNRPQPALRGCLNRNSMARHLAQRIAVQGKDAVHCTLARTRITKP